jgi:hypothetical protein
MRLQIALLMLCLLALASPAPAQQVDDFEQPVMGSSEALPDGVPSESSDALTTKAHSSDQLLEQAGSSDADLAGAGVPVEGASESPDAITTDSENLADLPAASAEDQIAPAALPPAPVLPLPCSQPAGDAGWSQCLGAVSAQLSAARTRLAQANAALSRSITGNVNLGEARARIIADRDAARAEVTTLSASLASQLQQARDAGVSSSVTAPYEPQPEGQASSF